MNTCFHILPSAMRVCRLLHLVVRFCYFINFFKKWYIAKVQQDKEQLTKEKQWVENQLTDEKVQVKNFNNKVMELTRTIDNLNKELRETKEKVFVDNLPKRARDIFLGQVVYRVNKGKSKSALGVLIGMWVTALKHSFIKPDNLNPDKEDRIYLESLIEE